MFRVLSRVYGIETPINTPQGKKLFFELANSIIPTGSPDTHNQAVMEFGALFCTPQNPLCEQCPLQSACVAFQHGLQHSLPVKVKAKKSHNRYFYYFALQKGKSFLLKKRTGKDIWQGLYDFYLVEKERSTNIQKIITEDAMLKNLLARQNSLKITQLYKHVLSHQKINARFVMASFSGKNKISAELKLYSLNKIAELPKPVLISRFLADQHLL